MSYKVGDKVYVISWGKQCSSFHKWVDNVKQKVFNWKTEIPDYSSTEHHWEYVHKPKLTLKGVPFKNGEKELVSKTPKFENYKYEIVETLADEDGETIYLLASTHTDKDWMKCYVQMVGSDGFSLLTPQQYADEKFNALLEHYRINKLSPELVQNNQRNIANVFPEKLVESVYDKNDRVLFGSNTTLGKVHYDYIPADYMTTGNPYIISVGIKYDGKGNSDLPEGSKIVTWAELKTMFPDNQFAH